MKRRNPKAQAKENRQTLSIVERRAIVAANILAVGHSHGQFAFGLIIMGLDYYRGYFFY